MAHLACIARARTLFRLRHRRYFRCPEPLRCAVVAGANPCSGEPLVTCGMRSVGALLARRPVVTGSADAARADRVLGPPGVAIALYRATAHVCARAALAAVVGRARAVAFPTAGPRVVAGTVDVAGRAAFASSSCIPFWGKGKGTGAKRRGFAHESARARRGGWGGWGSGTMSNILSIRCPTPPAPAHTLLLRRGGGVTYARRAVTLCAPRRNPMRVAKQRRLFCGPPAYAAAAFGLGGVFLRPR